MLSFGIIGAGPVALCLAAELENDNHPICLCVNRDSRFERLAIENHGKFIIDGTPLKINKLLSSVKDTLAICDHVFVCISALYYPEVFQQLMTHRRPDQFVYFMPGNVFGAYNYAQFAKMNGYFDFGIAEFQTSVYTARADGVNVLQFAKKTKVSMAARTNCETEIMSKVLPRSLRARIHLATNYLETSLQNVSGILHPIIFYENLELFLTSGRKRFYVDGATSRVVDRIIAIDSERVAIQRAYGFSPQSLLDWFQRVYECKGNDVVTIVKNLDGYRAISAPTTINHRYFYQDVPFCLAPLETVAAKHNIMTPEMTSLIDDASAVTGTNLRDNDWLTPE
tara:strand:- start:2574 stop:3590 length:1017 start_codon:yes stop_codon:yes gene_type:complete